MHRMGLELWDSIFRVKENCMHYSACLYRAAVCGQNKLTSRAFEWIKKKMNCVSVVGGHIRPCGV